jgi:protein-disulfide isomerase
MEDKKSIIDSIPPRSAFKFGLITGIAGILIIGFFVLLGMIINDKTGDGQKTTNTVTNNQPTANQPTATQGIQLADIKVDQIGKDDWVKGDSKAKISLIEFSDADCPYCTRFHETVSQILKDYDGKVKVAYRHFPLPQLHPEAPKKAEAIECVGELGGNDKVWAFMDKLFVASKPTVAQLGDVVAGLGIDKAKFQTCLDSGKYTNKVSTQSAAAQAAGAQGTPYSVIIFGDKKFKVNGAYPYEDIKKVLDTLK